MAKKITKSAERQIVERARNIITELNIQSEVLTKKDIAAWRKAHQMAINVENPNRSELLKIYDYTVDLDTQVTGVTRRIKFGISKRKFRMVEIKSGKENPEVTNLLETGWFKKCISLFIDHYNYGHSLIWLDYPVETPNYRFAEVELIPRRHVCPEYGVLLPDVGDEPLKKGINYLQEPYTSLALECGDKDDLGLYLKVAPAAISKKHVLIFWDNFAEKFGLPIMYANTSSNNEGDVVKLRNMLQNMGNAPWGIFPEGTELKLIETAKGDAFRVFDKRVELADKQICIALGGQTMVFQDGSSRAQAEVHEAGFEELKDSYADDFKDWVNISLIPFCLKHKFPFEGFRFEWDDSKEYTPGEMKVIEEMLLNNFEVDGQYFIDKYNVPITGRRQTAVISSIDPEPKKKLARQKSFFD